MLHKIQITSLSLLLLFNLTSYTMEQPKPSSSSSSADECSWMYEEPDYRAKWEHAVRRNQWLEQQHAKVTRQRNQNEKKLARMELALIGAEQLHAQFFDKADVSYADVCLKLAGLQTHNDDLQADNNTMQTQISMFQAAGLLFSLIECPHKQKIKQLKKAFEKSMQERAFAAEIIQQQTDLIEILKKENNQLTTQSSQSAKIQRLTQRYNEVVNINSHLHDVIAQTQNYRSAEKPLIFTHYSTRTHQHCNE